MMSCLADKGLDVPECDLVVNLDLPQLTPHTMATEEPEELVALGGKGISVTVCEENEEFSCKEKKCASRAVGMKAMRVHGRIACCCSLGGRCGTKSSECT